jgi:hypothetical protein
MSYNMGMVIENRQNKACDYSQRVVPLGGQLTVEMQKFACITLRLSAEHDSWCRSRWPEVSTDPEGLPPRPPDHAMPIHLPTQLSIGVITFRMLVEEMLDSRITDTLCFGSDIENSRVPSWASEGRKLEMSGSSDASPDFKAANGLRFDS